MQNDIDLEFQPEFNAICYLLDAPIFLSIFAVVFLCLVVFHILENVMMIIAFALLAIWLMRFLSGSNKISTTSGVLYPDRLEVEVGLNNPIITMIEYKNLKKVFASQTPIQKLFGTYSINFIYISEFTGKDVLYTLRDFKSPQAIINRLKKVIL